MLGLLAHAAGAEEGSGSLFLSLLSGTYRENQTLVMEALKPGDLIRYAIEAPDGSSFTSLAYREPLRLTAIRGEEREYALSVELWRGTERLESRSLRITIDRMAPPLPAVDPAGGAYEGEVKLGFSAPPGAVVFYAVNSDILTEAVRWDGAALALNVSRGDQVIQYYAMDEAGNRSDIATELYTRAAEERTLEPRLEIVSPAEGVFANHQLLYLISEDVGTIRYTLDGSDPTRFGSVYTEPRLLQYQGQLRLRVAAYPAGSDRNPLLVERVFQVEPESDQSLVVGSPSGVYAEDQSVEVLGQGGTVYYSLSDLTPDSSGLAYGSPLRMASVPDTRKVAVLRLRLRRSEGSWAGEYRYCYVLDRRRPPAPVIEVAGKQPARSAVTARIDKDASATVRYTVDGSEPGASSPVYTGPFSLAPAKSGLSVVKAISVGARGAASAVVSRSVLFDIDPPAAPVVRASELSARRAVRVEVRAEKGARVVQEMAPRASDVGIPGLLSPEADAEIVLDVPVGARRDFFLRFAAVDEAGNTSAPTELLHVLVDKEPPACPGGVLALDGTLLDKALEIPAVSGLPELRYEVRSDGSVPPDPILSSPLFESNKGLTLTGTAGELTRYVFKALLRDELGNTSDAYGPYALTVDRRKPKLPPLLGVADGQILNAPTVRLSQGQGDAAGIRVAYTYTSDGSQPEAPSASSPVIGDGLTLKGIDGQEVAFALRLLPISASGNLQGDVSRLGFVIDRKPPALPAVSGATDGERSGKPLVVTLSPAAAGDELYYSVSARQSGSAAPAPADPVASGRRYAGPVALDAESGEELVVILRGAAMDRAGNRSAGDVELSVVIDKRAPDPVVVAGLPATGVTKDPVTLTMSSPEPQITYEMTDDGSLPPPPGPGSPAYVSPILASGRDGAEVEYRVRCLAVDKVGNVASTTTVYVFTIDRKAPPTPLSPSVAALPSDPSRLILAWQDQTAARIFHRVAAASPGEFKPYAGPFVVGGAAGKATVDLDCYAEDEAGNRSPTVRYSLSPIRRLATPALLGAEEGGLYSSDRVLVFDAPGGAVRYEMTLDGTTPPLVTESSRRASGPLELSVPEGATMDVAVRLKAFPEDPTSVASAETLVSFRIDKTPPQAPIAEGITDGGFYRDAVTANLLSAEGTIYCRLEEGGREGGTPEPTDENRYREPLELNAGEGEILSYRLVAYAVDEAGNRSSEVRSWHFTLDNKVIYVSEAGDDRNPGTRDKPLKSVAEAVRSAAASPLKEIHVALGTYVLDETLLLREGLTLVGGFAEGTWELAGLGRKATLTASAQFGVRAPLVSVTGGPVRIVGFRFTHPAEVAPTLLAVLSAEARLEECAFYLTRGEERIGIDLQGGKLTVVSSELEADDGPSGSLLRSRGGALTLSSTSFKGPRVSASFAAIAIQNGSSAALSGVHVEPGSAQRSDGILVDGSDVTLARCTVESGTAGTQGAAVRCVGSRVEISDSTLAGSPGGMYTFAVHTDSSSVTIRGSRLVAAARAGATGIKARGGELLVERCEIRAVDTREFAYLVDADGATTRFFTNVMVGGKSGDFVGALLAGGTSSWLNNTIVAGTGTGLTAGFYVSGSGTQRIVNNIIARKEGETGTAIVRIGEAVVTIAANDFAGWSYLLGTDSGSARTGRLVSGGGQRAAGIDELNAADGDRGGGPITGNVKESYLRTFRVSKQEDYHLAESSVCVNHGISVAEEGGPTVDMDGERRPAPLVGAQPAYDIGADELY